MHKLFHFKHDVRTALDGYYNATRLPKSGKYIAVHLRRGDKMKYEYNKNQIKVVNNIDWWCESISHLSGEFLPIKNNRLPLPILHLYIFLCLVAVYVP